MVRTSRRPDYSARRAPVSASADESRIASPPSVGITAFGGDAAGRGGGLDYPGDAEEPVRDHAAAGRSPWPAREGRPELETLKRLLGSAAY